MRRVAAHVLVEHPGDVRAALLRGARRFEVALRPDSLAQADYRVARVRARAGPGAALGIDAAAAAWDVDDARRALARLAKHAPAWVIDPVAAEAMGALAPSPVPLIIDLARTSLDPAALRRAGAHGVLLRPGAPRALHEAARAVGLRLFLVVTEQPPRLPALEGLTLLVRGWSAQVDDGDLLVSVEGPAPAGLS